MTEKKQLLLGLLVIWLFTFLAYSNHFSNTFQFDDTHVIESNVYIRSLNNIPLFFTDTKTFSYRPENSSYRPMTTLFLALGFKLSKIEPWGYHLLKLIEHCLVATLILLLGLRFLQSNALSSGQVWWISFFSALTFSVHRIHTEVINYISAVSSLQAGLFFLLSFYLYVLWRERKEIKLFVLSVFTYLLSILSKEEGITLPLVILIYELVFLCEATTSLKTAIQENWKSLLIKTIPYFLVALAFILIRNALMDPVHTEGRTLVPTFYYFITQIRAWLFYWFQYLWPVRLNADNLSFSYSRDLMDLRIWGALAVHIGIWVGAVFLGKRSRFVPFAVAWMYITVLPASSVFSLVAPVNEHRSYIPYMMMAPLVVLLIYELIWKALKLNQWRKNAAFAFFIVATVLLAVGTHARNKVWRTNISLWEDNLAKNPKSFRALNILGISLFEKGGDPIRARQLLEQCYADYQSYLPCTVHLSMVYSYFKEYQKGYRILRQGLAQAPDYPHLNYHTGFYLKNHFAQYEKAKRFFEKVERLSSGRFIQATVQMAEMELEMRNFEAAEKYVQKILRLDPSNGDAMEVQGKMALLKGDLREAQRIFEGLYSVASHIEKYPLMLGNVYERQARFKEAEAKYLEAVNIKANLIQGWQGIMRVSPKFHSLEHAKKAQNKVQELISSKTWVWVNSLFMVNESPKQTEPK